MDADTEARRSWDEEDQEETRKRMRPPSSYGSMRSDSDVEEDEGNEEELPDAGPPLFPVVQPEPTADEGMRLQMIRSESPETIFTVATEQTKPPGAVVIDTRMYDEEDNSENAELDMEEDLITNSPEPPEPVEPDNTMQNDENGQPGTLHPEQDLPHIFRSIQNVLARLTEEELFRFKTLFHQWETDISLKQAMKGDILDFVDKILEVLGQERSLWQTISTLESIHKKSEADELKNQCKRAIVRFHLKQYLIRKHQVIREGVIRAGKQNLLHNIYVEPQISTCGYGGVDPFHELRPHPPSPLQIPSADTFVGVNNLFRLQTHAGQPVRTVLTTGIPGSGMSVSVGKFCLDWAELRANRDLQFVFKLSLQAVWLLRNKKLADSQTMSVGEVIDYYYPECKGMNYLQENDRKLIIMDSFDCYQAPLDWENAPVISDTNTKAPLDVLLVNIIRGTVLRGARVWILGRRAAVSQIPPHLIDAVTEIQGFSDEMKDDYMIKRFSDGELAAKIITHYKRLPTLSMLARNPLICWMVATVFESNYCYHGYGEHPPRLTPFYISILIVQTNRRLQFYYGKSDNELKWSNDDVQLLTKIGRMAFKMLQQNAAVFLERDLKECDLDVTEVTVFSGMCTELPAAAADGVRRFCFMHLTLQEFMAALYVFTMFHLESNNILDSRAMPISKIFTSKSQSAAALLQCAVDRTLGAPLGHYDMFLRFLCGLLSHSCHDNLKGYLYQRSAPKVNGVDEARQRLEKTIEMCQEKQRERVENLKECLREMTQEDV